MSFAHTLWQANQDLAYACLHHPFVQGIGDGSLPEDRFRDYVGQDAFFLTAFARAYSLAAARTPDLAGFVTFHDLAAGVLAELRLHQGYAETWGIDLQQVKATPVTQRYTDFLLATAWGQSIGLTAVALAPCMRLYAYLGQSLAATETSAHNYMNWIETYSSPDFEQLAQQLETLIDQYATPDSHAHSTYRYAMLCERDFFQTAYEV